MDILDSFAATDDEGCADHEGDAFPRPPEALTILDSFAELDEGGVCGGEGGELGFGPCGCTVPDLLASAISAMVKSEMLWLE